MKKLLNLAKIIVGSAWLIVTSCNSDNRKLTVKQIDQIDLKRGDVISCGPPDKEFGTVVFETSCSEKLRTIRPCSALLIL